MGQISWPFGGITAPLFSGISLGAGSLYVVANTIDTYAYPAAQKRFGKLRNQDGSPVFFAHNATASAIAENGIKEALAQCKANRNDHVIVLPSSGSYYTDEALTVATETTHLIAPAGMSPGLIGATKTVRIAQITASTPVLNLTANYCEVAGLWMKNYYSAATIVLTAAQCADLHHNYFALQWTGGTNLPAIQGLTTGGAWGCIHHNYIVSQAGNTATCAAMILIDATATSARVEDNLLVVGDGNTATVGINNQAVKGTIIGNFFSEANAQGGASAGVFGACIGSGASCAVINNRGAVATGHMLDAAGTTNVSYSDNRDGQAGGATPVTT